jgi:hypothetical protein
LGKPLGSRSTSLREEIVSGVASMRWTMASQENLEVALEICERLFPQGSQYCWKGLDLMFIDAESEEKFAIWYMEGL